MYTQTTTIVTERRFHRNLKRKAIEEEVTMSDLIIKAVLTMYPDLDK